MFQIKLINWKPELINLKRRNKMIWLMERFREKTSWTGIIIAVAAGVVILGFMPLTKVFLWGAVAWGVYSFWKKD